MSVILFSCKLLFNSIVFLLMFVCPGTADRIPSVSITAAMPTLTMATSERSETVYLLHDTGSTADAELISVHCRSAVVTGSASAVRKVLQRTNMSWGCGYYIGTHRFSSTVYSGVSLEHY